MRLATDPTADALAGMAARLHDAASAFLATSIRIESAPLDGPDWAARYDEALALTGPGWKPADLAVRHVRDAVAQLGSDPRVVRASQAVRAAIDVLTGGYRDMGTVLRHMPADPTAGDAANALSLVGGLGHDMAAAIERAALTFDLLAAGPPLAPSRD
jgi:hypothetical protein